MRKKINVLNQSVPFFMRRNTLSLLRSTALILAMVTSNNCFAEEKISERQLLIEQAKKGNIGAISALGYEKPYIAETSFKCGNYAVHITTSCHSVDKTEARAICYTQHFEFSLGEKITDFFVFNPNFRKELMIAFDATCFSVNSHHWLRIGSTNFGSGRTCLDCERYDYFDESAHYLGSSSSKIGTKIVSGYKRIPNTMDEKLGKIWHDKRLSKKTIYINLYPVITGDYLK
jgi:hypothetical protein